MTLEDTLVDGAQCIHIWKTDSKDSKMSLEPWVDGEATGRWVHTSNILNIVDLLEDEFGPIVPVIIVHVLPYKGMRLYSAIGIDHRHVDIVNEVNKFLSSRRAIVTASFFLQWFFHDLL